MLRGRVADEDEILALRIPLQLECGENVVDAGLELGVEAEAAVVDVEEDVFLFDVGCANDMSIVPAVRREGLEGG